MSQRGLPAVFSWFSIKRNLRRIVMLNKYMELTVDRFSASCCLRRNVQEKMRSGSGSGSSETV